MNRMLYGILSYSPFLFHLELNLTNVEQIFQSAAICICQNHIPIAVWYDFLYPVMITDAIGIIAIQIDKGICPGAA